MTELLKSSLTRRAVLQAAAVGAVGISPTLRAAVYAQGSDAPEKKEVKIGFIPLTDCASVVMASVLGLDKKHGVTIIPSKEASCDGVHNHTELKSYCRGWPALKTSTSRWSVSLPRQKTRRGSRPVLMRCWRWSA